MSNQEQYVTITHYKEREFYFLNYAIQTEDGFIAKDIEQFHESDKVKFIEQIRKLQSKYSNNNIVSISLVANQVVSDDDDKNRATAKISQSNYVTQHEIDVGDIPTTLYFSPFAILYEHYESILSDKLILVIGYFDRKLFMMFVTKEKIHQSWIIGTRGLTEKQIAKRVYKSMQAYYKISYSFANYIEMLVTDENPKLLKFLREELSLHIELAQSNIHNLLHHMASSQERAKSSYIKSFTKIEIPSQLKIEPKIEEKIAKDKDSKIENKIDISKLDDDNKVGLVDKFKSLFSPPDNPNASILATILPLLMVLVVGGFFYLKNSQLSAKLSKKDIQISAQKTNIQIERVSKNIFQAMGKNAELKRAVISTKGVDIKGVVWGIEPLKNSLNRLYNDGKFTIKPLENFMTEFSFISKK
jgi:hypothetical protein